MTETFEHKSKQELLTEIETSYQAFENLLTSLTDEQLTTSGVNGTWSIKDNLAHLSVWMHHVLEQIHAVKEEREYSSSSVQLDEDTENEQHYQENKDRPLNDVRNEFRSTYQLLHDRVVLMTEDDLNRPLSWKQNRPIWPSIVGNSSEHYQEHGEIIQRWLQQKTMENT